MVYVINLVIQWNPLVQYFFESVFKNVWTKALFSITTLIQADFAAAAVLISFGALIGKVSPIFYNVNFQIGLYMGVTDAGGSIVIHAFGAFFGLAATNFLTTSDARSCGDNSAIYHSDLFAMIGTVFLYMVILINIVLAFIQRRACIARFIRSCSCKYSLVIDWIMHYNVLVFLYIERQEEV